MPNQSAQTSGRRTLRVVGTGEHHLTKIIDADTGEDIGIRYGVSRIEYRIGDKDAYPEPRLILELLCPVIIEINPLQTLSCAATTGG